VFLLTQNWNFIKYGKYDDCRVKKTDISEFEVGSPERSEFTARVLLKRGTFSL
jgi:hypothetical protein